MKPLPALLLVFAAAAAFAQGAYRWVGKDGKVHYSDAPPAPEETQKVEQKKLNASVIDSGGSLSYETRQAARDFPVTLYTAPDCDPACKDARDFLRKRGIPFAEKVVKTNSNGAEYKKATGFDAVSTPTLLVGTKPQKGFEEGTWGSALEAAGYPVGKQ